MDGIAYIQLALAFISVMLSGIFYISWRSFGRGMHSLVWCATFAVTSVQWACNILHYHGWAVTDQATYWMLVSGLAYTASSLGLIGYLLRAGKRVPLRLFATAILAALAITLWASLPGGHVGLSIAISPFFTVMTTSVAAWVLLTSRSRKNAAEWGAAVVNIVFAGSQLAAAVVAFSMGATYDPETSALFLSIIFTTLPTAFTGAGLFMVTVLASDLAEKVTHLSAREQERLKDRADRYWRTLEEAIGAIPDLVSIEDGTGRIAACNQQFAAMLGMDKKDLVGRSIQHTLADCAVLFDRVDGQKVQGDSEIVGNALYRALKKGDQLHVTMQDGRSYVVDCAPVKSGGNILVARNITEIQTAKTQLEEAISSMPLAFALFDADNCLVACNTGIEKILGQPRDWIADQNLKTLLYELLAQLRSVNGVKADMQDGWHEAGVLEALNTGATSFLGEMADGSWYQISSRRMASSGFVIIAHDVTQRRQLEISLERNEAQLRAVLKGQPFPVLITRNSDGAILFASSAAEQALDVPMNSLIGARLNRFLTEDATGVDNRSAEDDGQSGRLRETLFRKGSGATFPVLCSSQELLFQSSEATVMSFIDLSDKMRLETELKSQREALFQSEKLNALGTLLAGVAHELNNPLTVVVANAHVLSLKGDDPDLIARANKITEAAERCSGIVRSFLAMARKGQSEKRSFNMAQCVENALNISGFGLRDRDIKVTCEIEPDLPDTVGDADQLSQVVINLMVNAQHALANVEGKREVALRCFTARDRQELVLEVEDNGPGISEDIRQKVFDPFFTTKQVGSGTGLGLFLVRGTVKSHGGSIDLVNKDGPGALFRMTLPIKRPERVAARTIMAEAQIPYGKKGQRILIVDDEPGILDILHDILEHNGHTVHAVSTGQAALDVLARSPVDLVISDLRMPGMSGEVLYSFLKKDFPAVADHTAFMTGDSLSDDARRFLSSCGRPVLNKPFAPKDVLVLLEKLAIAS